MAQIPVLCIVGPTASGKSALALSLAQAFHGEIVSMDSMQIYRRMDIGTAKPTANERLLVPHHMLDIVEPTEPYTVSQYAEAAESKLQEICQRGKLPMLVGGTGFYLRAITNGLTLGGAKGDVQIRTRYESVAEEPDGKQRLHDALRAVDPETAERLHCIDVRRVIRALEVYELTGTPFSKQQQREQSDRPYRFCMLGTSMERGLLYDRIERRVDDMLREGLLTEVEGLLQSGVSETAQAMQGIGYKEFLPVLLHNAPLADAVSLLKQNTRHYAKRQGTWFRAETRIRWLDAASDGCAQQATEMVRAFLRDPE